jgi:hypothetical protein
MNLSIVFSLFLFCFASFGFSSGVTQSPVAESVKKIHDSLVEGKNNLLAEFLSNNLTWDVLAQKSVRGDNDGFRDIFFELGILCYSAQKPDSKCIVKLTKEEINYLDSVGKFTNQNLKYYVEAIRSLWNQKKMFTYQNASVEGRDYKLDTHDLEILVRDIEKVLDMYQKLVKDAEIKDVTFVPLKEIVTSLSNAMTKFNEENWKDHKDTYRGLMAAVKGDIGEDKGKNGDKAKVDNKVKAGDNKDKVDDKTKAGDNKDKVDDKAKVGDNMFKVDDKTKVEGKAKAGDNKDNVEDKDKAGDNKDKVEDKDKDGDNKDKSDDKAKVGDNMTKVDGKDKARDNMFKVDDKAKVEGKAKVGDNMDKDGDDSNNSKDGDQGQDEKGTDGSNSKDGKKVQVKDDNKKNNNNSNLPVDKPMSTEMKIFLGIGIPSLLLIIAVAGFYAYKRN